MAPKTNVAMPNTATSDGRLLPVSRHYYHIGWTFEYDAPTQAFTLQAWTGGVFNGQIARVAYEFGSGDDQGVLRNAGYIDNIQDVTANSIVFTDARKRGALSSQYVQLVQTIGLQLNGHGRRLANAAPVDVLNGVAAVPFGAGGEYNALDEAVCDAMFSAVIKGLECQLLPSNQTTQCAAFLGNCFLMPSGTGFVNSGVTSLGTADRRGSYTLGSELLLLPNPDNSQFQPNRLLFSKPIIATEPVVVQDIPGAAARTDGDIFVLDMIVFVDSASVILGNQRDPNDASTFEATNDPNNYNSIQPASTRDAQVLSCLAEMV